MDLRPITLPPDWDAQQDCQHFVEVVDRTPKNYTTALWELLSLHYENFRDTVERTLRCAYACDAALTRVEPSCLTPLEKVEAALDSVRRRPQVYADPPRLVEYLEFCQFAENERARILRDYRLAGDQAWMYPVIELIDMVGGVEAELRDTVSCEEDARAERARPD